ncbi:hypothetical protein KEM52_005084 [Ascosphaera acerosa]|nr:hypothetical protein KEM52_005084 [Ascosphaera acerosa]
MPHPRIRGALPLFIRPLPARYDIVDVDYLETKGALRIPDQELRTELLRAYIKFVHPFMPLLDLEDFLSAIAQKSPEKPVSLLLFQAVMFAGTAYVPIDYLKAAGFSTRKVARKTFFLRARILYDLDYESDRIALVQSLLLMTHWYEMPDDQKDTWHWMGVSISLAHTIGIHRDPSSSSMDPKRQRLWKRIWWSTYTRDREIALGMRRPTRIKDEDCDVPLLTLHDFEIETFSQEALQAAGDCDLLHDLDRQRDLAQLFIEKSRLCLCISRVLTTQYSVLSHKNFGGSRETTMMLVPKKAAAEASEVRSCDQQLETWYSGLPTAAHYCPSGPLELSTFSEVEEVMHTHRALLKMVYLTTSSALHRPQVLPSTPMAQVEADLQEMSRAKVRKAAVEITDVAQDLHKRDLVRFLPTTGITVLLPAVIIHLLDIKCNNASIRAASLTKFYQCMQIIQRLREIYCSADFAAQFLEAAIRKADIHMSATTSDQPQPRQQQQQTGREDAPSAHVGAYHENLAGCHDDAREAAPATSTCPPATDPIAFNPQELGRPVHCGSLTPPPDSTTSLQALQSVGKSALNQQPASPRHDTPEAGPLNGDCDIGKFVTATPPQSVPSENGSTNNLNPLNQDDSVDNRTSDSPFAIHLQAFNSRDTISSMGFGIPGLSNPTFATTGATYAKNPTTTTSYPVNPSDAFDTAPSFDADNRDLDVFRNLAHDVDITPNDFDALINFDDNTCDYFMGADMAATDSMTLDTALMGKYDVNETAALPDQGIDWMTLSELHPDAAATMTPVPNPTLGLNFST